MGRVGVVSEMRRLPAGALVRLPRAPQSGRVLCGLAFTALVVSFYHTWFGSGLITAGDWSYITQAGLRDMVPFPSLWNAATTMGEYNMQSAPDFPLQALAGALSLAHLEWAAGERLVWIYPALVVPSVSTYVLALLFFRRRTAAFTAALAVIMNSYAYLIYEGGQFGVAVGYGFVPLVLWSFVRGQQRGTLTSWSVTGIVLSVQAMYDIRSTYMSLGILLIYGLVACAGCAADRVHVRPVQWLRALGLPHIATALAMLAIVHLWWILPALFVRAPTLPSGYGDVAAVRLLSIVHLDNGLSLFHPFWFANDLNHPRLSPVNPLFFIVPLLVFGLLLRRRLSQPVLFLTTIALIAVFLVKGDNDPAGWVYDWLFVHLPGFSFFRDASKFYQPLALAYALLLGAAAARCARTAPKVGTVRWRVRAAAITGIFVLIAVFPAYPALLQQSRGTFVSAAVPGDYRRFNDFVDRQHGFFRVLWAPTLPRFGTFSSLHPALDAAQLSACCIRALSSPTPPWAWLGQPGVGEMLRALAVRYIVVPDDTNRDDYIGQPWPTTWPGPSNATAVTAAVIRATLPGLPRFAIGRLHVFVVSGAAPLLFARPGGRPRTTGRCPAIGLCDVPAQVQDDTPALPARGDAVSYVSHGTSWYDVPVHVGRRGTRLVFAQTYDPDWQAFIEPSGGLAGYWATLWHAAVASTDHTAAYGYANVWWLRRPGKYHVILVYWPQRLVLLGGLIAVGVVLSWLGLAAIRRVLPKKEQTQGTTRLTPEEAAV